MKLLKAVPAVVVLAGGFFASVGAMTDDFTLTVMDDPSVAKKSFEGAVDANYLAQSNNTKSSSMTADSILTWYNSTIAWSLWGNASNTPSSNERSSEKYVVGGRSCHNLADMDCIFGQGSWLTDRHNGYQQCDALTAGYGRRVLNGSVYSLQFELDPGVRYDEFTGGETDIQPLGYTSGIWTWQVTNNAKFTQGISAFDAEDTTANSESVLNVTIDTHLTLEVTYSVTWNSAPLSSASEHTDRRTLLPLEYKT